MGWSSATATGSQSLADFQGAQTDWEQPQWEPECPGSLRSNTAVRHSSCTCWHLSLLTQRDEWMTFDFLAMKTTSTSERRAEKERLKEEERAKAQAIEQVCVLECFFFLFDLFSVCNVLIVQLEFDDFLSLEMFGFVQCFSELCLLAILSILSMNVCAYVITKGWASPLGIESVLERWRNWAPSRGKEWNCSSKR